MSLPKAVAKELRNIVGSKYCYTGVEDLACYAYDSTHLTAMPWAVLVPADRAEVAAIARLANSARIPLIPRGSGTGSSGGTVPERGGIVLSMQRLNRIMEVDTGNLTATVQPGVLNGELQQAVRAEGLFFPPDPGSQNISTLGGNVAENAGGPRCLKYGVTKDYVLGLEIVLADGRVIHTGGKTLKNVSGYNLTGLFVGSEGTLGIVTEITLKLIPLPESKRTLLASFNDLQMAAAAVSKIISNRIIPTALELMDNETIRLIEQYRVSGLPLEAQGCVLIDVDGNAAEVGRQASLVAEICRECGGQVTLARDDAESERLWEARRSVMGALAASARSMITEDVAVPRTRLVELIGKIKQIAERYSLRIPTAGHAGDGNLHPSVLFEGEDAAEMVRVQGAVQAIFRSALEMGGTLSGEHGIGLLKRQFLGWEHSEDSISAMRAIKTALDPNNIMNPGKIFPPEEKP